MKFKFWFHLLPEMVLLSSKTLPLEQKKEYDFLNGRIIESFTKMVPFWLESKWKKKKQHTFLWGNVSLHITTPWCFMNINIYNSDFFFQAANSNYLIFQIINLKTRHSKPQEYLPVCFWWLAFKTGSTRVNLRERRGRSVPGKVRQNSFLLRNLFF